jgi:hypothetical protein
MDTSLSGKLLLFLKIIFNVAILLKFLNYLIINFNKGSFKNRLVFKNRHKALNYKNESCIWLYKKNDLF